MYLCGGIRCSICHVNQVVVVVVVGYSLLHWPCEPGVYICVGVFVRYSIGRVNQVCVGVVGGYSFATPLAV